MLLEARYKVLNCTPPANYFHALRRQIRRPFAKPLIVRCPCQLAGVDWSPCVRSGVGLVHLSSQGVVLVVS